MATEALAQMPDDQSKWLKEASMSIKRNSFYMKKALDEDNLREALRYCAAMLGELRTSLLGPQKYYELYMHAFDELRHIEMFFGDESQKGRSYEDLYELVQHAGNVLPRLYLMCTVGSCFIRSKEGYARDVLKDLAEMCKGVQHPTRGLFLRCYLCQVCRGLLPDVGSPYEGDGGSINDALEFLLLNFTEMNKLWVRMQHQGSARDREKREKERQQLADLVGKNLTYISQLEGLTFQLYNDLVLPRVVHQVVACKDDIAQQYLMQCLIQGFPDDFHLATLDTLLNTCSELQAGVKVFLVMSSLMDRLAAYAKHNSEAAHGQFSKVVAFAKLREACTAICQAHPDMPLQEVIAMYGSLLGFTVNVYKDDLQSVDSVLQACCQVVAARDVTVEGPAEKRLVALLSLPLDHYNVITVLELQHYPAAMALLKPAKCKEMALKLIGVMLKNGSQVKSLPQVKMLFDFVEPLVKDTEEELDDEDISEQQSQVGRMLHLLQAPTPAEQFAILQAVRDRLLTGMTSRYQHTLPSLIVIAVKLVHRTAAAGQTEGQVADVAANSSSDGVQEAGADKAAAHNAAAAEAGLVSGEAAGEAAAADAVTGGGHGDAGQQSDGKVDKDKLLLFILHTIQRLVDLAAAEIVLQLYLMAAFAASEVAQSELMTYECYEQAFTLYEESIPDSRAQVTALQSIVSSLARCHVLGSDNRSALVHKATGYCGKLLKKPDQCRAICLCSHLYWQPQVTERPSTATGQVPGETCATAVRDPDGVMLCLKRALKVANAAQQQSAIRGTTTTEPVSLFVEILNHYLYFFDQGLETITTSVLQNLLELTANEMASEFCQQDAALKAFYSNTLKHIIANQDPASKLCARYKDIVPPKVDGLIGA